MKRFATIIALLAVMLAPASALATNGMNMIAYGGQESGMAGAAQGLSDNPAAMNNNPAGLTRITGGELLVGLGVLMPKLSHGDAVGGTTDGESAYFPLPTLAYAQRIGGSNWWLGMGAFAQGGMGAEFRNYPTAFGAVDSTYTNVRYLKLTPTVAYKVNKMFSLGASLHIGYADMEMRFFPHTAVAGVFSGMKLGRVHAFGYSAKLGAQFTPNDMVAFGLTYTTRTNMDFEHGKIRYTGVGSFDAEVEGFNWPSSIGFGVAVRPTQRLLLAADVTFVQWSEAVETVKIKSSAPAPMNSVPFVMDWEDQWVFAVGAAYRINDLITVRAGYNYAKNPVPAGNLSPLFPAIVEHHVTVGLGLTFSPTVKLDLAWEHGFENSVTYNNPNAPFGPGAEESHSQNTLSAFVTFSF